MGKKNIRTRIPNVLPGVPPMMRGASSSVCRMGQRRTAASAVASAAPAAATPTPFTRPSRSLPTRVTANSITSNAHHSAAMGAA